MDWPLAIGLCIGWLLAIVAVGLFARGASGYQDSYHKQRRRRRQDNDAEH